MPNDPKKRTYAQLIAEAQAREAIKGKTQAAAEIADRTEGKAVQAIRHNLEFGDALIARLVAGRKRAAGE